MAQHTATYYGSMYRNNMALETPTLTGLEMGKCNDTINSMLAYLIVNDAINSL